MEAPGFGSIRAGGLSSKAEPRKPCNDIRQSATMFRHNKEKYRDTSGNRSHRRHRTIP